MPFDLLLPGLLVVGLSAGAGLVQWPLRPMDSVRTLAAIAAIAGSVTMLVLLAGVAGLAVRLPGVALVSGWCGSFSQQHAVSYPAGVVSTLLAAVATRRVWQVVQRRRRAVVGTGGHRMTILETNEPIAYAAPGDPGCVVVSRGLLDGLTPRERQVVIAHERAHLHLRHHRYLLIGELSVAVMPLLHPLVARLRLATERSADESAAEALGGDRRSVATAIARAAVMTTAFPGAVGALGGASVRLRVEALVAPQSAGVSIWSGTVMATAAATVAVVGGSAQAHHLAQAFLHLCGL